FLAKKLITALILPPTSTLFMAMCGLLLLGRAPRVGRALAWLGVLTLLILSLPPVSVQLTRLVGDSAPLDKERAAWAQAIVVLGGGLRRNAVEYGGDRLNRLSLERVRYAAALARETPLPILVTGGAVYGRGSSEAEVMREVLEKEYSIPVRWVENQARNTYE